MIDHAKIQKERNFKISKVFQNWKGSFEYQIFQWTMENFEMKNFKISSDGFMKAQTVKYQANMLICTVLEI